MVMARILVDTGLSVLRGEFGMCPACWIGEQGHSWNWSDSHPASRHECFLSYP